MKAKKKHQQTNQIKRREFGGSYCPLLKYENKYFAMDCVNYVMQISVAVMYRFGT